MRATFIAALIALLPLGAAAQDAETLADIRQELQFVYGEVLSLKRELSETKIAKATAELNEMAAGMINEIGVSRMLLAMK